MTQKSQVFSNFQLFKNRVETQFNTKIKQIQTDSGGEYQNVSKLIESLGIIHRVSCPHTQEQNGAVERRNRIIIEKGLTLLVQASLPILFGNKPFIRVFISQIVP